MTTYSLGLYLYRVILYRKLETCLSCLSCLSVCLSVCPPSQGNSNPRKIWGPKTAPDADVFPARIDSGHTYKGALRLELRDPAPPAVSQ